MVIQLVTNKFPRAWSVKLSYTVRHAGMKLRVTIQRQCNKYVYDINMQPTGVTVKTAQYITVGHCNLAVTNFELATH